MLVNYSCRNYISPATICFLPHRVSITELLFRAISNKPRVCGSLGKFFTLVNYNCSNNILLATGCSWPNRVSIPNFLFTAVSNEP